MFGKYFGATVFVLMVNLVFLVTSIRTIIAEDSSLDFGTLTLDLIEMNDLFQIDLDQQTIVFDSEAATRKGFYPGSIKLAEEMSAFTNEIVDKAARAAKRHGIKYVELINIKEARVNINKYPALKAYSREASARRGSGLINRDFFIKPNDTDDPKTVCGSVNNPVPSSAAAWTKKGPFSTKQNAEQELSNLGYYKTSRFAGGGYTRNQTYNESICKKDNYRDHASNPFKNTSDNKWYFNEQNYTGDIPGEPNPVMVKKASNWPYLTWPYYVWWWHRNF